MTTIWTNGCFDIVHIGHIYLFQYAKSLGHQLVVGIDDDNRVKSLKGQNRPVNTQQCRKQFLESIKYIDHVVIFSNEEELRHNLKKFNVDTIVIGDDYRNKPVIGSDLASVVFFPRIPNISSSSILSHESTI